MLFPEINKIKITKQYIGASTSKFLLKFYYVQLQYLIINMNYCFGIMCVLN